MRLQYVTRRVQSLGCYRMDDGVGRAVPSWLTQRTVELMADRAADYES